MTQPFPGIPPPICPLWPPCGYPSIPLSIAFGACRSSLVPPPLQLVRRAPRREKLPRNPSRPLSPVVVCGFPAVPVCTAFGVLLLPCAFPPSTCLSRSAACSRCRPCRLWVAIYQMRHFLHPSCRRFPCPSGDGPTMRRSRRDTGRQRVAPLPVLLTCPDSTAGAADAAGAEGGAPRPSDSPTLTPTSDEQGSGSAKDYLGEADFSPSSDDEVAPDILPEPLQSSVTATPPILSPAGAEAWGCAAVVGGERDAPGGAVGEDGGVGQKEQWERIDEWRWRERNGERGGAAE